MLFCKLQSISHYRSISLHSPYSGNSAWFPLSGTRHTLFVHLTHRLLQQKDKNSVYTRKSILSNIHTLHLKHLFQSSSFLISASLSAVDVWMVVFICMFLKQLVTGSFISQLSGNDYWFYKWSDTLEVLRAFIILKKALNIILLNQ